MFRGEIIGKKMKVVESKNKDLAGIHGKVVDETKQTLVVVSEGEEKTIMKKGSTFDIDGQRINGEDIAMRPEDRVKA